MSPEVTVLFSFLPVFSLLLVRRTKGAGLHHQGKILTKVCCGEHMFPVLRSIYLCLVGIKTSAKVSWDAVIETWTHSLLLLLLLPLLLQHKPSQGNNKQMSGVGTAPRQRRQVLERRRLRPLWFPGCWGTTAGLSLTVASHRQELEKPDRNYRYLLLCLAVRRPESTRTHTRRQVRAHRPRVKRHICQKKPTARICFSALGVSGRW